MAVRITRAGLGLTVGIIVLALVVLGGLYLAKERGEQARRADAIEIAQQSLDAQSGTGTITPSIDGDVEESGTVTEGGESEATTTPEEETTEEAATQDPAPQTAPEALPQTGANEGVAILASALLTFAGVSYLASRRALSTTNL